MFGVNGHVLIEELKEETKSLTGIIYGDDSKSANNPIVTGKVRYDLMQNDDVRNAFEEQYGKNITVCALRVECIKLNEDLVAVPLDKVVAMETTNE